MAQAFYGTRISEHISETPEGFLIAHDAVLCRTAVSKPQKYRGRELGLRTDEVVDVYRASEEVLSQKFLASLNGKPVTDTHPGQFLTSENASWYVKGHAQNIRPGPRLPDGEQSVIGDLVVTDAALIAKIKAGVRELSVGYDCRYEPRSDGAYEQRRLRGNHIALVDSGRAGEHVRILDAHREPAEDFAAVANAYRGQPNPSAVAAERAKLRATNDGTSREMLRAAESRSFDDLAEELHERYSPNSEEEESMPKKIADDKLEELRALVKRVVAEELAKNKRAEPEEEEEPEEATDAVHPALVYLRKLRPAIQASGDRSAIDAYNTAVRAVKRQTTNLVSALDALPRRTRNSETVIANDFEGSVRRARAHALGEPEPIEKPAFGVRTADSTAHSDAEQWGRDCERLRQQIRNK